VAARSASQASLIRAVPGPYATLVAVPEADRAVVILGALAHPERRGVLAGLVLGATTLDDLKAMTGLSTRTVSTALGRLADAGLVVTDGEGSFWLLEEAFRQAAIDIRPKAPPDEHAPSPRSAARVLRSFVRDGRLRSIPTQRSKRLVVLDLLAQEFEPGRCYHERSVNTILKRWHEDHAALRRYLVDEGFLAREGGQYWRTGGSFSG